MKQILIIPDRAHKEQCLALAEQYHLGFEYNDFFLPDVLDDASELEAIMSEYRGWNLPEYTTVHGAFFDVIPASMDSKIREIAKLRIEQSIDAAKRIGAGAVVFHTNYNPFLNSESYNKKWIEENVHFWSGVLKSHGGIQIYMENMFDASPDLMERLSEQLAELPNYGVCFDYAHAALSSTPVEIWAKQLGRFVKHIHINDNDSVSDLHLAWGEGMLNRAVFYECYEQYMSDASVLIETTSMENKVRSLEMLKREGFMQ